MKYPDNFRPGDSPQHDEFRMAFLSAVFRYLNPEPGDTLLALADAMCDRAADYGLFCLRELSKRKDALGEECKTLLQWGDNTKDGPEGFSEMIARDRWRWVHDYIQDEIITPWKRHGLRGEVTFENGRYAIEYDMDFLPGPTGNKDEEFYWAAEKVAFIVINRAENMRDALRLQPAPTQIEKKDTFGDNVVQATLAAAAGIAGFFGLVFLYNASQPEKPDAQPNPPTPDVRKAEAEEPAQIPVLQNSELQKLRAQEQERDRAVDPSRLQP